MSHASSNQACAVDLSRFIIRQQYGRLPEIDCNIDNVNRCRNNNVDVCAFIFFSWYRNSNIKSYYVYGCRKNCLQMQLSCGHGSHSTHYFVFTWSFWRLIQRLCLLCTLTLAESLSLQPLPCKPRSEMLMHGSTCYRTVDVVVRWPWI